MVNIKSRYVPVYYATNIQNDVYKLNNTYDLNELSQKVRLGSEIRGLLSKFNDYKKRLKDIHTKRLVLLKKIIEKGLDIIDEKLYIEYQSLFITYMKEKIMEDENVYINGYVNRMFKIPFEYNNYEIFIDVIDDIIKIKSNNNDNVEKLDELDKNYRKLLSIYYDVNNDNIFYSYYVISVLQYIINDRKIKEEIMKSINDENNAYHEFIKILNQSDRTLFTNDNRIVIIDYNSKLFKGMKRDRKLSSDEGVWYAMRITDAMKYIVPEYDINDENKPDINDAGKLKTYCDNVGFVFEYKTNDEIKLLNVSTIEGFIDYFEIINRNWEKLRSIEYLGGKITDYIMFSLKTFLDIKPYNDNRINDYTVIKIGKDYYNVKVKRYSNYTIDKMFTDIFDRLMSIENTYDGFAYISDGGNHHDEVYIYDELKISQSKVYDLDDIGLELCQKVNDLSYKDVRLTFDLITN